MNVTRHHADWLSLVEVSGPFISLPVLQRVFSEGLPRLEPEVSKMLRAAYEEWRDNPTAPGKQRAWVLYILTRFLGYPPDQVSEGQGLPAGLETNMPEMGETLRPDFALFGTTDSQTAGQAQLLITSYPSGQALDRPVTGKKWKATPATRMMELLHGSNVPLGLVTNGEHWMLVYAPRGEITGFASWYSTLWLDETITLRAFHALLCVRRFFGVAADKRLFAILKESSQDQQEVTDQLGYQIREAVEVLVQSFDTLDRVSNRNLLKGIGEQDLYNAALTVMMRLVFLFSAEERGLLHLGKPLYDDNYAVSTLQAQLQEVADRHGEEVLERRSDAWTRLLATFRAVHGGVRHQDLLMPAYGGSLFDPDRYSFLEGRPTDTEWLSTPAEPILVNNRVVLHLLNSLQRLRTKVGAGTAAETRRVSYRALGVEQIGHVYEGLLDHTAIRASEPVLGIQGTRSKEPEIPLSTLESWLAQGADKLCAALQEATGRSVSALRKALKAENHFDEHRLFVACGQDDKLLARLRPFAGLIRDDSFDRPLVILPGSVYVTAGITRRSTGTHYTPPSLTEPIVQNALEPLVYEGPAIGWPREKWRLKPPKSILELRVCDMAMGSGAFLVQACRYISERLMEAWENEEKKHPGQVLITPDGKFSEGSPSERFVPTDMDERVSIARRVVADRCLYGVDINPMAVEMAKLSLWLITVDHNRPFTFLDHAFKCGDSLLGVSSFEQIEKLSLRPGHVQIDLSSMDLFRGVGIARNKRQQIEAMASDTPDQILTKAALYAEAEDAVAKLKSVSDVLVAFELKGLKGKTYNLEREKALEQTLACWAKGLIELQMYAREQLDLRRCLHWPLEFPEIVERGGFDAFIGNPPFIGGQKITGNLGTDYRDYLVAVLAGGRKGSADLCAYFFLRVASFLIEGGMAGMLATNTIAQGNTREVGLEQIVNKGFSIPRAIPSHPWPGVANLEVAHVWLRRGKWEGTHVLEDQIVPGISPFLTLPGKVQGKPYRLKANENKSFQGSNALGMGFVLTPEEAQSLINSDCSNADCLFPYLNGEDLNSRSDQTPSRWVIYFFDWPLKREADGCWNKADKEDRKSWLRQGVVPRDYPNPVAADFPDLLAIIEEKVKPERDRLASGDATAKDRARRWWQFARPTRNLYNSIGGMERFLVHPLTSKHHSISFFKPGIICSHMTVVLAVEKWGEYALLQSEIHWKWSLEYGNKLETRPQYTPSGCFETFPFPVITNLLSSIGERYYQHRQSIMQNSSEGLTATYNRFHDPTEHAPEISQLHNLHIEMDQAVAAAYGWQDLELGHGFHETKQGLRFTISEAARREVLDRLLALNHQCYTEEIADGLHDKKAIKSVAKGAMRGRKKMAKAGIPTQRDLFSSGGGT